MTFTFEENEFYILNKMISNLYMEYNKIDALQHFLETLKDLCFFEKGDIYIFKKGQNSIQFENFIFVGWGKDLNYYFRVCDMDDALPIISLKQPIIFKSSELFTRSEREKTRYFKECLEPCNMYYSIEGNLFVENVPNGYVCGLGLHRSEQYEDFTAKDLELIKIFKLHLTRTVQDICEAKHSLDKSKYTMFSHDNILAYILYDWDLNIRHSNIPSISYFQLSLETIQNMLISMCKTLKQEIATRKDSELTETLKTHSKINLEDKSYYAHVNYNTAERTFSCYIYDYSTIIDNILLSIKETNHLTLREYEILECLINGLSNTEIMEQCCISMPTVKKHVSNIYQKLDISGRHQLFQRIFYS